MDFIKKFYSLVISFGNSLQSFILAGIRLYWGCSFLHTGWQKLHNIDPVADFFSSLGVPFPLFNAYLTGFIETVGGFCLLIGFASRLVSIPLICVLSVALFTAHYDALVNAFSDPQNLIEQLPFNYLLATILILAFGPGKFSLDALVKKSVNEPK